MKLKLPPSVLATQLDLGDSFQSLAPVKLARPRLDAPTNVIRPLARSPLISVPVDPSFDVGQGLREIKPNLGGGGRVAFDWRHLDLAREYMGGEPDPHEPFVTERGGLVSLATAMNVFRVQASVARWAKKQGKTVSFAHTPPPPGSPARRLYDVLGVDQVVRRFNHLPAATNYYSNAQSVDSRYVSPIVMVDSKSKPEAISHLVTWIEAAREAGDFRFDLMQLLPEIAKNIVEHSVARAGSVVVAIWPLGEVDLLWSNQIGKPADIFDGEPKTVASRILGNRDGSGMYYILNTLLPRYAGTLGVNFRGSDIMIYSGRRVEIFHPGRRSDEFVADSVLFDLKLFTNDAVRRPN